MEWSHGTLIKIVSLNFFSESDTTMLSTVDLITPSMLFTSSSEEAGRGPGAGSGSSSSRREGQVQVAKEGANVSTTNSLSLARPIGTLSCQTGKQYETDFK